ncbi:hypothetical protein [Paraburkholderia sp. SIMBA_054]|uniref:hypothetical protein n=1 Tax=Paraburkholderia sp. SIMBA_054 TaxID=3085795 RepID=UPI0039795491
MNRTRQTKDALAAKRTAILAFADAIPLRLPDIAQSALLDQARHELEMDITSAVPRSTEDQLAQHAVTIALRGLEHADNVLRLYDWNPGVRAARSRLLQRKLNLVASRYPTLSDACGRLAVTQDIEDEKAAA